MRPEAPLGRETRRPSEPWRPPEEGDEGVPSYFITYSDMMSLLFTFFVALLAMSTLQAEQRAALTASIRQSFPAIGVTGAAPGGSDVIPPPVPSGGAPAGAATAPRGGGGADGGGAAGAGGGMAPDTFGPDTKAAGRADAGVTGARAAPPGASQGGTAPKSGGGAPKPGGGATAGGGTAPKSSGGAPKGGTATAGGGTAAKGAGGAAGFTSPEAEAAYRAVQARFASLARDGVELVPQPGGALIRLRATLLFPPESDQLLPEGERLLGALAPVLAGVPGRIRVEGHTDDSPIRTERFPSNWELSAARAVRVVRTLSEVHGLDARRLLVVGYGGQRPLVPNDTPEHRERNHRVEVYLVAGLEPR